MIIRAVNNFMDYPSRWSWREHLTRSSALIVNRLTCDAHKIGRDERGQPPAFRLRDAIGCDRGGSVYRAAIKTGAAYRFSGLGRGGAGTVLCVINAKTRAEAPRSTGGRGSNAYLFRWLSMASQASSASASVLKGEPPILMALVF
jgi:hypothetical protein